VQRRHLLRALIGGALASVAIDRREGRAQEWIIQTIYNAASRHGVSGDWLMNTAACESGLDPWAYNAMTGDSGIFQFKPSTWAEWGGDPAAIWDVWSQADMAAWAFSVGLHSHWCCSGTWGWEQVCL
jgi:hypothetical protein